MIPVQHRVKTTGTTNTMASALAVAQLYIKDWFATLFIGFMVASFWRGTWVLLDIWLCDQPSNAGITTGDSFCFAGIIEPDFLDQHQDSGWISLAIGLSMTMVGIGMMWMGLWRPRLVDVKDKVHLGFATKALRCVMVWILAVAAVNLWRGVWYLTDYHLLPNKLTENEWGSWPLTSFWVSSVVGTCHIVIRFGFVS